MKDSTDLLGPEDRPAERVPFPEMLREELVDEIVGRVLDHLDLFEDDLLLLVEILGREVRVHHDVGEQIDRGRQVLVEDLDVVAGVFLRRERVELAADRVDGLGDVLGRARAGPLEQHVLDEMGDAAAVDRLVPGPARQPDAEAHRPDVRHRLGDEAETGIQDLACDHACL